MSWTGGMCLLLCLLLLLVLLLLVLLVLVLFLLLVWWWRTSRWSGWRRRICVGVCRGGLIRGPMLRWRR